MFQLDMIMMEQNSLNILKEKVKYFKLKGTLVHVDLFSNPKPRFYNGIIIDIAEDMFILDDRMLGELPVFWGEVETLEPKLEDKDD